MTVVTTTHSFCRLGISVRDITPPVGIYHRMWGAATHDRSTGVHRGLEAAVFAFADVKAQQLDPAFVLITLDHCLFWPAEMQRLKQQIHEMSGIDQQKMVITFSHTHAAGLMDPVRKDLPGGDLIEPYLAQLGETLGEMVREAVESMEPVTITYATGRCNLAQHRDFWDESSRQFVCGYHPDGPVDDTVLVARVTDRQGLSLATMVNYGCHPTTLAWENKLISPDYPGAMREVLEENLGVPCVFLLSPCGDVGPKEGQQGDVKIADRNGRQLGYAALSAWESLPPPETQFVYQGPVISGATLGDWRHEAMTDAQRRRASEFHVERLSIPLPYREDRPTVDQLKGELRALAADDSLSQRDHRAMVERLNRAITKWTSVPAGPTYPYDVVVMKLGEAIWLTFEGEPYQLLQTELRRRFPGVPIVMSVIGDGWRASYLPIQDTYGRGIYPESIAILAPGCLERLIEQISVVLEKLVHPE